MANLADGGFFSFVAAFSSSHGRRQTTAAAERRGDAPTLRGLFTPPPIYNETSEATRDADFVTEVTSGTLETEDGSPHVLAYEVHSRRPNNDGATTRGLTALFLHGGPGAACNPGHVRFFDPSLYQHVVLLDQRGCGKSTPKGETKCNRIELLVLDIERLRLHLFDQNSAYDVILGGSWGCTLALAYAHAYPRSVRAMVLRGVCMFRPQEIDWLFGDPPTIVGSENSSSKTSNLRDLLNGGNAGRPASTTTKDEQEGQLINTASQLFPNAWNDFVTGGRSRQIVLNAPTNTDNPRSALQGHYHQLMGKDSLMRIQALKSWMKWEMGIYSRGLSHKTESKQSEPEAQLLVWNPHTKSWSYEDAGDPLDMSSTPVDKDIAQSLRRFSKASNAPQQQQIQPLLVQQMRLSNQEREDISRSHRQNGFVSDQYVPAQAILTCFYSTNDDFVMNGYRTFMSLSPPDGIAIESWYSSKLPPASGHADECISNIADEEILYPLPPTIAIQGGRDGICPPDTSLDLHALWPQLELRIAMNSGHSMYDKVISGEIINALDRLAHGL
mmetsp:Transcript_10449/g.23853  ORF Transcript_10449/g.23853 Transcript_10449/m.23853 type:complete len:556 (+) Transcript_10449:1-1668(+)